MNDISTTADLRGRMDRYAMLAEHTPTPIWFVDMRAAWSFLEPLRAGSITERAAALERRPGLVDAAVDLMRVVEVNRAAVALVGADDPDELVGSARGLFGATPGLAARVLGAGLAERRTHVEQARMARLDGVLREVVITAAFASPDTAVVTVQDVTEQLRMQAQLRQLQADFAHAARISTLGELATSIAHEIRQPLAAIVTNADTSLRWLQREEPNLAKVGELTNRIAVSAQRASDIIQRVRGMALKHEPERVRLDLADVIDDALHFVRHDLDARGIALAVEVADGPTPVHGDRVQLQQVVVNLLVNSIHAIDQAGSAERRIEVGVEAAETVVLTIRDTGPGIAEADEAHLFEGFFTTKPAGMGIGLTICRSIVTEHGGQISAANHPAGGALFRVMLPLAAAAR